MKIIVKEKQFNKILKEEMFFDSDFIDKICNIMIKETQFYGLERQIPDVSGFNKNYL